jgi:hypothetical protein
LHGTALLKATKASGIFTSVNSLENSHHDKLKDFRPTIQHNILNENLDLFMRQTLNHQHMLIT